MLRAGAEDAGPRPTPGRAPAPDRPSTLGNPTLTGTAAPGPQHRRRGATLPAPVEAVAAETLAA
eukprot:11168257-Lingulodinium_polyedra.AAC.1